MYANSLADTGNLCTSSNNFSIHFFIRPTFYCFENHYQMWSSHLNETSQIIGSCPLRSQDMVLHKLCCNHGLGNNVCKYTRVASFKKDLLWFY